MGDSKIIVVANQKGGVGKSTLCMLLANYLSKEVSVDVGGIIDTDPQRSINKKRNEDLEKVKGTDIYPPYGVFTFPLSNHSKIPEFVKQLRDSEKTYIIDTPGTLDNKGVVTYLALADYILCPFDYDDLTLTATTQFLIFWNNFKDMVKSESDRELTAKVILVPCRKPKNVGTKEEIELWSKISSSFEKRYRISPEIPNYAKFRRCNTLEISPEQRTASVEALQFISEQIYSPNIDNNYDEEE